VNLTRRDALALGAGATSLAVLPLPALADVPMVGALADFTGGAAMSEGGVSLTAPEIAENGKSVPIEVDAPGVAIFAFGPLAGSQSASTRIRLAGTQNVVAVAKMANGSFAQATKEVKVIIGGCGG